MRLPTARAPQVAEHFEELEVLYETSLLSNVRVKKGRHVVAMSTGYIQPYNAHEDRFQYIVVVTEGWNIVLFNHKLEVQWEHTVEADLGHMFLHEVAAAITSHSVEDHDTGLVVVGGRLRRKDEDQMYTMHRERERMAKLRSSGGAAGHSPTVDELLESEHNMGEPEHFSFFAFEGKSGKVRWTHDADDFYGETSPEDILHPQHKHHKGEVDWRNFRQSMTNSLPHHWATREDTSLILAHFEKRRSGKESHRRMESKRSNAVPHSHVTDLPFGGLKPHLPSEHINDPNSIVAHLRDGVEVIHLYTGRPLCRISLKRGAVHADLDADGVIGPYLFFVFCFFVFLSLIFVCLFVFAILFSFLVAFV